MVDVDGPGEAIEEIRLRALQEDDVPELLRIHRLPEVAQWWDQPPQDFPHDEPEATRLTVLVDGQVAGMVQHGEEADPKYRHAWIDVFLDPTMRGRGIGTEVVGQVVDLLLNVHGHHRITIDPALANAAAIRCYEKVGFRRVGIQRRAERDADGQGWHDSLLMDLLAEDRVDGRVRAGAPENDQT